MLPGGGGHDLAAEPDQGGPEAVGVHLRGQRDRPVRGDVEPVRGPALRAGRPGGPGVDPDQAERLQFRGDRARGRPGHAEFRGEQGAGRRAAGVHQGKRGTERTAAALKPCPNLCHPPILTLCRR